MKAAWRAPWPSSRLAWLSTLHARYYRPWLLVVGLGWLVGYYAWELRVYNQDFAVPHPMRWRPAVLLILVWGPIILLSFWFLYSLTLHWFVSSLPATAGAARVEEGFSLRYILAQDAWTYSPLLVLAASPLFLLLFGRHSTEHQATVVVLVSLSLAGVAALKAWALVEFAGRAQPVSGRFYNRLVGVMAGVFVVVSSVLVLLRYGAYNVWGVDLGLVDQALWNTLHGRFMEFTYYGGVQTSLLALHFEPIFLLVLPLYAVWSDPRLLLLVQAIAVGTAAIPVYRLALARLQSNFAAACIAVGYLVFPATVMAGLDSAGSLRSDTLAMAILLWALYFLESGHRVRFLGAILLALACKEYVALVMGLLGLYIIVRRRDLGLGLVTTGLALIWFCVVMWGIVPALRGGEESLYFGLHFSHLGGDAGFGGLVKGILDNPARVFELVLQRSNLLFLFFLLLSAGFLPLLDLPALLVGAPILGIFFLRQVERPISLGDHHYYVALPFLFLAAVGGVSFLQRKGRRILAGQHPGDPSLKLRLLSSISVFFLACSVLGGFFWGTSPLSWSFWSPGRAYAYWRNEYVAPQRAKVLDELVGLVPADARVLASDYALSRLAQRATVDHFFDPAPDALSQVDYALVDLLQNRVRTEEAAARETSLLSALLSDPDFGLTRYEEGVVFFQRGAEDAYASQAQLLTMAPQPQVRLERNLGGRLRLLGYDPPAGALRAGERYRVTYYWQVLDGFARAFEVKLGVNAESVETHATGYVIADSFVGLAGTFHVVHLPTHIQMPPGTWQAGQIIRETYDFRLPADAQGAYEWLVGMYVVPRFLGLEFSAGRQLPDAAPIVLEPVNVGR